MIEIPQTAFYIGAHFKRQKYALLILQILQNYLVHAQGLRIQLNGIVLNIIHIQLTKNTNFNIQIKLDIFGYRRHSKY